jgi:hypothetical protein
MAKAPVPYRVIIDSNCALKLRKTLDKIKFSVFVINLMYINTNSVYHKKNHIVTSEVSSKTMKQTLKDKVDGPTYTFFDAAMRPQCDQELETIHDEVKRIWEYAIDLST